MINAFLKKVKKHIIAESTNLSATNYAKRIFNVKAADDIDNGKLVNLDDMKWVENEYFTMVEPTATSRVGLILSVADGTDETPFAATLESNFYNGKDEIMRVYDLQEGDKFTISDYGVTPATSGGTVAVGSYVKADGYDIVESTTKPTGAFYGEIVEKINRTNGTFFKILVRQNG